MRLAQFEAGGKPVVGMRLKDSWIDLSAAMRVYAETVLKRDGTLISTIDQLLREGMCDVSGLVKVSDFVSGHNLAGYFSVSRDASVRPPVMRPGKIIALGRNYVLHAREASLPVPREPIIFVKATSSVTGPYDPIAIPREYGRIDHEAELGVVIGRRASAVRRRDAFRYVAGYTIVQDISARDLQVADLAENNPWFRSKSFDTFTPMGPCLVMTDEIKPPVNLKIECLVNGKTRQKANTRDMVFDIPTVIEFITRHITLEPGDVISTGTPEGIGEIRPGDVITTRISGIGEMKNKVTAAAR